ncbi:hypothetical protein EV383_4753 [Pseudonocardia sediminis]|uniref:Uncharacterized protein n=1 Tax=Pseudonocardia sediminis TaxID=1397368 RepID=A0A4Q7V0K4_PSEST|nr:hypothetical protein [Pseudonocardia sediminis]RZT87826.1 hypothetical protein EV383_4753 [Pseudonocardia sediminis]
MGRPDQQPPHRPEEPRSVALLGARRALREAEGENVGLRERVAELESLLRSNDQRAHRETGALRHQVGQLRQENLGLRNRDALAYEQETEKAAAQLAQVRTTLAGATESVRTEHLRARDVAERSRSVLAEAVSVADRIVTAARANAIERERTVDVELVERRARIADLDKQIVVTEDLAMLQEAGIYEFRHRLEDAVAYKSRLEQLKDRYKSLQRKEEAVLAASG